MEGTGQNKDSETSKTAVGALTETQEAGGQLSCVGTNSDQLDHTLSTTPETKLKKSPSPFPNQMTQQSPHTSVLPKPNPFKDQAQIHIYPTYPKKAQPIKVNSTQPNPHKILKSSQQNPMRSKQPNREHPTQSLNPSGKNSPEPTQEPSTRLHITTSRENLIT